MSDPGEKSKASLRRHRDEVAVKKQAKIVKQKLFTDLDHPDLKQPHRLHKKHAMDCGNPGCFLCGNPRKISGDLTTQEQRLFQDMDNIRDRHSNGIEPDDDIL
jgi:hypothetical protein